MSRSRRVFRLGLFSFRRMCAKPVRQMCAKSAENRPAIHRGATERTPARTGRDPAARLAIAPARPLGYPFARPLGYPFAWPSATRFARPFARPFATLGNPSGAWPRLPLGYPSACAFARPLGCPLAHRRGPPRTRADHPKRKADRSTERPAPRRSIFLYALGPLLPVLLGLLLAPLLPSATPRALGLGYPLAAPRRAPLPVRSVAPSPIAADRRARAQITPSERRTAPRNGPPLGARYSFMR